MATATLSRKQKRAEPEYIFGIESNGILMSLEEFDQADPDDFDECWDYELINGVLIVSPIPSMQEADMNEQIGYWFRKHQLMRFDGAILDVTLPRRYVKAGVNRRLADRVIWAGIGRLPHRHEAPTIVVELVSKRKRDRELDYETKCAEYQKAKVQEYWIIDRFQKIMTAHFLERGKYRKKVVQARQTYRTQLLPGFELPLAKLFKMADQWDESESEET